MADRTSKQRLLTLSKTVRHFAEIHIDKRSDETVAELFEAADYLQNQARTPDETSRDDQLVWDTIAQNTRLLSALTKVTESWVNGRRVLDGIPWSISQEAREALKLRPAVEPAACPICGRRKINVLGLPHTCYGPPEKATERRCDVCQVVNVHEFLNCANCGLELQPLGDG